MKNDKKSDNAKRANLKHKSATNKSKGHRGQSLTSRRKTARSRIRNDQSLRDDSTLKAKSGGKASPERASRAPIKRKRLIGKSTSKAGSKAISKRPSVVKKIRPQKYKAVSSKKSVAKVISKKRAVKILPKKTIVKKSAAKRAIKVFQKKYVPEKAIKTILPAKGLEARLAALEAMLETTRKKNEELERIAKKREITISAQDAKLERLELRLDQERTRRETLEKTVESESLKRAASFEDTFKNIVARDMELERIPGIPMLTREERDERLEVIRNERPDLMKEIEDIKTKSGAVLTPQTEEAIYQLAYQYDETPTELFTIFFSG